MKRCKKIFLMIFVCLFGHTSFSQSNESKSELISRTRSELIDAFAQNDREGVRELHRYFSENFDKNNYVVLFPDEEFLLFVWYHDFESMIQYIPKIESERKAVQGKILPSFTNNFYQAIRNRVEQESEIIFHNLQMSPLTQEEKDFVAIYLQYYFVPNIHYFPITNLDQRWMWGENFYEYDTIVRKINTDTRNFVVTYPNSNYIVFFESYEREITDWGGGFGMNIGYSSTTGNFSNYFNHNVAVDIYLEAMYKKYISKRSVKIIHIYSSVFG